MLYLQGGLLEPAGADKPEVWSECDSTIAIARHLPALSPGELEKLSAARKRKGITLAS